MVLISLHLHKKVKVRESFKYLKRKIKERGAQR
jgi:hypothetical protein